MARIAATSRLKDNRFALLGIGALLVLNIVLIALALRPPAPLSVDPHLPPTGSTDTQAAVAGGPAEGAWLELALRHRRR